MYRGAIAAPGAEASGLNALRHDYTPDSPPAILGWWLSLWLGAGGALRPLALLSTLPGLTRLTRLAGLTGGAARSTGPLSLLRRA